MSQRTSSRWVVWGFSALGLVWGMYAAALPDIQRRTGVSDPLLGAAMASMSVTALPVMTAAGRLGVRRPGILTASTVLFGIAAPLAAYARSPVALFAALLAVGGGSAAFDVGINTAAARHERHFSVSIMNRSHASFSLFLLVGSLSMGALFSLGVPVALPLTVVGVALVATAPFLGRLVGTGSGPGSHSRRPPVARALRKVVVRAGSIVALALVVENGLQQWSAIFLERQLFASPAVASLGPATLAAAAVAGRGAAHGVRRRVRPHVLLRIGAGLAVPGVVALATAQLTVVALAGLALAGAGISVASPVVVSYAGRSAEPGQEARTISDSTAIGYVGLFGGPAAVGTVSGMIGLRAGVALLGLAALAVAVLAGVVQTRPSCDGPVGDGPVGDGPVSEG
ncbi:MAG: MFS transporter [Actinomycetota bacterium]|nr:MFS transporter [Actinomycetota bacterium]